MENSLTAGIVVRARHMPVPNRLPFNCSVTKELGEQGLHSVIERVNAFTAWGRRVTGP